MAAKKRLRIVLELEFTIDSKVKGKNVFKVIDKGIAKHMAANAVGIMASARDFRVGDIDTFDIEDGRSSI